MDEITCHINEDSIKVQPNIHHDNQSVIRQMAADKNRVGRNSVVVSVMLDMMFLAEHNVAVSVTAEQVRRNNSQLVQSHGTGIWGLTKSHYNQSVDRDKYNGEDKKSQIPLHLPPKFIDAMEDEYGPNGYSQAIREAISFYEDQSFRSLTHIMSVQMDVLSERYDTPIGSWIENNGNEWWETIDSETPDVWGQAYQQNTTQNTTKEKRAEWITEAFKRILPSNYKSRDTIDTQLYRQFGYTKDTARKKANDVDLDVINKEWFDGVKDKLDSDVAERVDGASDVDDIMDENMGFVSMLDAPPEKVVTDDRKEWATAKATEGYPLEVDWHDLTFESRVSVASEHLESAPEAVGIGDEMTDTSQIRASGDNQ